VSNLVVAQIWHKRFVLPYLRVSITNYIHAVLRFVTLTLVTASPSLHGDANGWRRPIPLKNSKIFRAGFSAIIDFCRMFEVISMLKLTGGFSRRNRGDAALPQFVRENNFLTGLRCLDQDQKRSFSTQ